MVNVTARLTSQDIRIEWLPLQVVPAIHIQHLYFDVAVTGGTFKLWVNGEVTAAIGAASMIAGTGTTFTADDINNELDAAAHGLIVGDRVIFDTSDTLPAPLTEDTIYYVVTVPTAGSFAISATEGGAAIDITTVGTGTHRFQKQAAAIVANIQAALDALPNMTAGDIVVSGTAITDIVLTASGVGNKFFLITVFTNSLTQAIPNANDKLQTEVTTQGSDWVVLSAQATSFNWSESSDLIDMTGISEVAATEIAVKRALSFDVSLFKANEDWEFTIRSGFNGLLWIFPEGKVVGKEHYQFLALIEEFGNDFPDHEKVEQSISGVRQGDWYIEPNTVYRG